MNVLRTTIVLWLACAGGVAAARAADLAIDDLMSQDPPLAIPAPVRAFSPRLKTLWIAALERPDAELRRQAAGTISLAHQRGLPGLDEAIEPLRKVLRTDSDPVVRRAAAQALLTLDARAAATDLAAAAQKDGLLLAVIAEPGLARWDHVPARDRWLARLNDPATPRALHGLAVEGLGVVRERRAVEPLAALARRKSLEMPARLAAARALGNISDQGLADLASEISDKGRSPLVADRLVAALLLARHSDSTAVDLLKTLAVDSEPAVARPALERLYAIDADATRPLAKTSLRSRDAGLRSAAAGMIAAQQDADAIRTLRPLLDDRNPTLRRSVAARFVEFAGHAGLRPVVLEESLAALKEAGWRGIEQAALVLGTLEHQPAAPRFVELLRHERPEVLVAAAWGLRKLRARDTLEPALQHATSLAALKLNATLHFPAQLSQLFQLFGDLRYREAEPLLRRFVPKSEFPIAPRMAALWALGCLYENQPENELAKAFGQRLVDYLSLPPEDGHVRQMAAVGLGKMRAKSQLPALRKMAPIDTQYSLTGAASYWAIEQITGEKPPPVEPLRFGIGGWFLEPTQE